MTLYQKKQIVIKFRDIHTYDFLLKLRFDESKTSAGVVNYLLVHDEQDREKIITVRQDLTK
jgi:hypothetical protein